LAICFEQQKPPSDHPALNGRRWRMSAANEVVREEAGDKQARQVQEPWPRQPSFGDGGAVSQIPYTPRVVINAQNRTRSRRGREPQRAHIILKPQAACCCRRGPRIGLDSSRSFCRRLAARLNEQHKIARVFHNQRLRGRSSTQQKIAHRLNRWRRGFKVTGGGIQRNSVTNKQPRHYAPRLTTISGSGENGPPKTKKADDRRAIDLCEAASRKGPQTTARE